MERGVTLVMTSPTEGSEQIWTPPLGTVLDAGMLTCIFLPQGDQFSHVYLAVPA